MIECVSALRGQPRNVAIEAIYRVSHELTTRSPSLLKSDAPNRALTAHQSEVAGQVAQEMIRIIEARTAKPISSLTKRERAVLTEKLYGYLRNMTSHGEDVRRQASNVLQEFRMASL